MSGPPSQCTPELVERICALLEEGNPLAKACPEVGITTRSFLRYCDNDDAVAQEYRLALAARAEWFDAERDRIRLTATDKDSAAAARVQLDCLAWSQQRMAPTRYGDRVSMEVDHKIDLSSVIDRGRQRVLEANARLGLPIEGDR